MRIENNTHLALDDGVLGLELAAALPGEAVLDGLEAEDKTVIVLVLSDDQELVFEAGEYSGLFDFLDSVHTSLLQRKISRRLGSYVHQSPVVVRTENRPFHLRAQTIHLSSIQLNPKIRQIRKKQVLLPLCRPRSRSRTWRGRRGTRRW